MRHLNKKKILDRNKAGRRALLANLAESLILYEKIKTTKAKAKVLKSLIEKMITVAKRNNLASRRALISKLYTANAVKKLMEVLGPRYAERKGGYTRLIMLKNRAGDCAEEAIIEFV